MVEGKGSGLCPNPDWRPETLPPLPPRHRGPARAEGARGRADLLGPADRPVLPGWLIPADGLPFCSMARGRFRVSSFGKDERVLLLPCGQLLSKLRSVARVPSLAWEPDATDQRWDPVPCRSPPGPARSVRKCGQGRTSGEQFAFQAVSLRGRLRDRDHRTPPAHLAGREQPAVRALQRARLPVHRRPRAALPAHARSLRRRGERAPGAARGEPLMAGSPEIVANGSRVVYSSRCLV